MPSPDPARPSGARFVVVFWLCTMAAVLYLDRICWAQAVSPIQTEFGLTNTEMAFLAMAFQVAYGVFEIPTGRWGERIGARAVLTRITIWWSVFTMLTGTCTGFALLLIVRFLFGAGEAGAYPNAARVFTRWFPAGERGRVQGLMLATSLIGGAASPTLAAYLIESAGWRWTFVAFGAVGLVWAAGFWWWFRDDPAAHPRVNPAELAVIRAGGGVAKLEHGAVPWGFVLRDRGIHVLGFILMCSSFNSYFYFTWFTKYLVAAHGVKNTESGWLTSLALTGAAVGMLCGGVVADRILKRAAFPARARRLFCGTGFLGGAAFLMVAVQCDSVWALATLAGLSCLCVQVTLPSWWSSAIEQCGRHVGPVFGLLNMMSTVGALLSQGFVGVFADYQAGRGLSGREQWDPMFGVYVCVLVCGAVGWFFYRRAPVEGSE